MKLYKYKNAIKISDVERDLNCILNDEIWFSKIEYLNDPFEGIANFENPKNFDYLLPKRKYSTEKYKNQLLDSSFLKNQSVGVLSLSKSKNNLVLWSHYCDNHKGYVVEYDFTLESFNVEENIRKVTKSSEVIYSPKSKKMQLFENSYDEYLFNKSLGWKYEKEFRFLSDKFGLVKYDATSIKSIIIGANTNIIIEEYLKKIANQKHIKIYKSIINRENFSIKIRAVK
ncbi:DUF2971 domain-containing protein [Chryseobacterium sp. FH1]|uniref:DUF2971 domain-containing protein n=1 Tax=Chryseobacterium sp. FH1 TaxID=1233951 RepID=UPI0004E42203|nr:DUF2971 domain-containing protein [Chryseobacterium sp. FH1]KFC19143.1 hypothetical protein IO90_07405 [Chryseobacterium sp. FH1]